MDEVSRLKARYAAAIEDGKKIEVFTSMPEYQWFIEHVIRPTIVDYTNKIMSGEILDDKEDWIMRGMVQGMQLFVDTPVGFRSTAEEAIKKAKLLQEAIENGD